MAMCVSQLGPILVRGSCPSAGVADEEVMVGGATDLEYPLLTNRVAVVDAYALVT